MSDDRQEEQILSDKLRKICNEKGEELYPEQSAPIFYEFALLYKRKTPNKISLIQSAALLNAAIVRQPTEQKFQNDLKQLCEHVLICADATKRQADLVKIANHVKEMVTEMRKNTNQSLENIKQIRDSIKDKKVKLALEKHKVKQLKTLQLQTVQQYTDIMAHISKQCIDIMGLPPCKFALVGMGSLARKEITPYSDFEHMIVLEELCPIKKKLFQSTLEYFRWYSVIFHVIVVNLQETIIRAVYIPCLNDATTKGDWLYDKFTTKGVSFDSMMPHACHFPLGRSQTTTEYPFKTELIKPVSEMVQYLELEEFNEMFTRTCFVAGDKTLQVLFQQKIRETQNTNLKSTHQQIATQLRRDIQKFDVEFSLSEISLSKRWNLKEMIYRSTSLYVSALGQIHGSSKNSNFEIIDDFQNLNKIDENTAHRLSLIVTIACHIRLNTYMAKRSQDDYFVTGNPILFSSSTPFNISHIISTKDLAEYMSDVFTLQAYLCDPSGLGTLCKLYSKTPIHQSLGIKLFLCLKNDIIEEGEHYLENQEILDQNDLMVKVYVALAYISINSIKSLKFLEEVTQHCLFNTLTLEVQSSIYSGKLHLKSSNGQLREVVKEATFIISTKQFEKSSLLRIYLFKCFALTKLKHYREALVSFRDSDANAKWKKPKQSNKTRATLYLKQHYFVEIQCYIGICLLNTGHPNRALSHAFEALEFCPTYSLRFPCNKIVRDCYRKLNFIAQAEKYESRMYEKLTGLNFVEIYPHNSI